MLTMPLNSFMCPEKSPVLMVPSSASSSRQWDALAVALDGFPIVPFELDGHGGGDLWLDSAPPTVAPASNHSPSAAHTRSRTALVIRGAVYTPGAISSITEARKPRKRGATLRVTTTVIVMMPPHPPQHRPPPRSPQDRQTAALCDRSSFRSLPPFAR